MEISRLEKPDFDQILAELPAFWGSRHAAVMALHHPMFFFEFGDAAFAIKDSDKVIAYLLGMVLPEKNLAYIHMVGCREHFTRKGYASSLYGHFFSIAKRRGCSEVKAITTAGNSDSIAFHQSLGFKLNGEPNAEGVLVIKNYRGPGEDRVVFTREL